MESHWTSSTTTKIRLAMHVQLISCVAVFMQTCKNNIKYKLTAYNTDNSEAPQHTIIIEANMRSYEHHLSKKLNKVLR